MMNERDGIEPMIFEKRDWTPAEKRKLLSLCLSPMDAREIAEYFQRSEQETLQQIDELNLYWGYSAPWFVYFSIPGTREILPALSPFAIVEDGGTPVLC